MMLSYEEFRRQIEEKFLDYISDEYKSRELVIQPIVKVNETLDGLILRDSSSRVSVSPTIYINNLYEHYLLNENFEEAITAAANGMEQAMGKAPVEAERIDYSSTKDSIVFQLINTEQNKGFLANVPNRQFHDLSIIYRWVVDANRDSIASAVIHNSLAERMGMTEEELFEAAMENTKRIMVPSIRSMNEVIRDILGKDGMQPEMLGIMLGDMPEDKQMYVISNERGVNGASSMLYEEELHKLAEKLETDLYILPSSVHEVIAISSTMGDPNELAAMVAEINMGQVALEERLSNQVYHYDKDARILTLATDSPQKRLDGIITGETDTYRNQEDSVVSKPIGRIDYLHTDGRVRESIEYTSPYQFKKDIEEENYFGVPMKIVLYKDKDGATIPQDFISQLDPPPQSFEVIDSPYLETTTESLDGIITREKNTYRNQER